MMNPDSNITGQKRMKGLIVKGIGGFYYIQTDEGLIEARGRGAFKKQGITLCVGDEVDITILDEDEKKGVIEKIFPRKNHFIRPPVSNIDSFAVVFAAHRPEPNYPVIDKFLITAEVNNIEPIICVNKCDLATESEAAKIRNIYKDVYRVVMVSSKTGQGIDELKTLMKGRKTAFAGPSGVGKSSILNSLHPKAEMETGEISHRTERGKHTTRHVEIFSIDEGGMIFDTPGFTSFEVGDIQAEELGNYYREFDKYRNLCRYDNCRHLKEPGCAVRDAVESGIINKLRYDSYVYNYEELKNKKKY